MNGKTKISLAIISAAIAIILAFSVTFNVLALTKYDNIFEQFLGKSDDKLEGDTLGADVNYVKSSFGSPKELYEYEEKVCSDIAEEGVTLLKNDGLLPLQKGTELSLFSHSSVDLVSGGSGSGSGSFELTADLKEGFEGSGLKVNQTLWNFYKSGAGSKYQRGVGVINYGEDLDWSINECPLGVIKSSSAVLNSFGNSVAMFVLSRTGGEGGDEARDMKAFGGKSGSHYLEPDDTELEIISYLNETFESVILLVNCNNAMELGFVADYPHIKAVVNCPGLGRTGVYGLGRVLVGKDSNGESVSPSGKLVDTFVYDNFSSPASQNMGDFRYDGTDYYYVNYAEGIYVGYKYYETRYEDVVTGRANVGNYDYSSTVLYPFGYGLSYTDFTWSEFNMTGPDADGNINVSVKVTNAGAYKGKDVVQVYVRSPYTDGGIEKSAVSLVGFAKTDAIEPGDSQTVSVKINLKDFASYDYKNAKTYVLEKGNYYITAAPDAHTAVNNILQKLALSDTSVDLSKLCGSEGSTDMTGVYVQDAADAATYSKSLTGKTITNKFDGATLSDAPYLSRSNWSVMDNDGLRYGEQKGDASTNGKGKQWSHGKAEVNGKQWSHSLSAELKAELDSQHSLNPEQGKSTASYTFGAKNGVDLIDLRGKSYDDPLWKDLLDEITLPELTKLIDESGYCTPQMPSINKPKVNDLDGPAGLNKVVGHGSVDIGDGYLSMTWPTEYLLACTWNEGLALKMGEGLGEDGLYSGVVGWYGPGMNIHRTPFSGRNFEYYSEDGFLSGVMGSAEIKGAAEKGMYAFVKHFALNDQETHRDMMGLITWADEQTIRELYLKPFEMCMTDNEVTLYYNEAIKGDGGNIKGYTLKTTKVPAMAAVMSSYNRIGTTWAGGNYNLLTGVLREEWGFNGFVLTDYEVPSYMGNEQTLYAGGDAKLKTVDMTNLFGSSFSLEGKTAVYGYAREAAHHILYTVANSAAMNGYVHGVKYVNGFAYYKLVIIGWDVLACAGVALLVILMIKKIKKAKKPAGQTVADGNNESSGPETIAR